MATRWLSVEDEKQISELKDGLVSSLKKGQIDEQFFKSSYELLCQPNLKLSDTISNLRKLPQAEQNKSFFKQFGMNSPKVRRQNKGDDQARTNEGDSKKRQTPSPKPESSSKQTKTDQLDTAVDAGSAKNSKLTTPPASNDNDKAILKKREDELKEKELEIEQLTHKNDDLNKQLTSTVKELNNVKELAQNNERQFNEQFNLREEIEKELKNAHERVKEATQRADQTAKRFDQESQRSAQLEQELKRQSAHFEQQYQKQHYQYVQSMKQEKDKYEKEKRTLEEKYNKLVRERDDLRDRFSKMAGAKLNDNNADIADLSDPNRALKLSEKFGELYDNEWTDAFQELTKTKMKPQEAIDLLLIKIKECYDFCSQTANTQMSALENVLLHPVQEVTSQVSAAPKEKPRVHSKDKRPLKDVRKQISAGVGNEVKQIFVAKAIKDTKNQKAVAALLPYLEKCADICWLMAISEPVLYIDMGVKPGDQFDPNVYTAYESSGSKVGFLVWPPLYNGEGGGLLSKGVVGTTRTVKK